MSNSRPFAEIMQLVRGIRNSYSPSDGRFFIGIGTGRGESVLKVLRA